MKPIVLLSVFPEVAAAILNGRKTLEIRRRRMRQVGPGSRVLLYRTGKGGGDVVGEVRVAATIQMPPDLMWRRYKDDMGVFERRRDFMGYVGDLDEAFGLWLESPTRFGAGLSGPMLPKAIKAPQSYCYLDPLNPIHQLLLKKVPDHRKDG